MAILLFVTNQYTYNNQEIQFALNCIVLYIIVCISSFHFHSTIQSLQADIKNLQIENQKLNAALIDPEKYTNEIKQLNNLIVDEDEAYSKEIEALSSLEKTVSTRNQDMNELKKHNDELVQTLSTKNHDMT